MENDKNNYKFGDSKYFLDLNKILNDKIINAVGYVSKEFGFPIFKVSKLILKSGKEIWLNGEHDIAYIEDNSISEEKLKELSDESQ